MSVVLGGQIYVPALQMEIWQDATTQIWYSPSLTANGRGDACWPVPGQCSRPHTPPAGLVFTLVQSNASLSGALPSVLIVPNNPACQPWYNTLDPNTFGLQVASGITDTQTHQHPFASARLASAPHSDPRAPLRVGCPRGRQAEPALPTSAAGRLRLPRCRHGLEDASSRPGRAEDCCSPLAGVG